ncbi:hypothetical protein F4774DRAFT_398980 [Daldinia eschscholtzii]|nr:hypothetical protein F4774DRAFT_398980 [Daldinia eschscholtzii]
MAVGTIQLKVKSFFHSNHKRRRRLSSPSPEYEHKKLKNTSTSTVGDDGSPKLDLQLASPFFRQLPIEIRRMIYDLVWGNPHDHKYHTLRGRHIHFVDGHWVNMRCVMYKDDEDLDFIQKNMDIVHNTGHGNLLMWQKRLASTWGGRHWRCEERVQYGTQKPVDGTSFMSMMLVCKRMFPEVMESILESHQFIFNDFFSAHRFFTYNPSPYITSIRHLDLSLSLPFYEYAPFIVDRPRSRVRELWEALERISCLHSLRVSLDIYDHGPWRKIPERGVTAQLRDLEVLGNFTVELPPSLPIKTHTPNMQDLDSQEELPFKVVRRPPLRYWQFTPGDVERFGWKTHKKGQQNHCFITLDRTVRRIPNPYLLDLF